MIPTGTHVCVPVYKNTRKGFEVEVCVKKTAPISKLPKATGPTIQINNSNKK